MEEVRNMVEDANVAKGKRGGCGFLEDMDDSLLFFFLLLVVLFNNGCWYDRKDDSLLFFFLLLVIIFDGCGIF